MRQLEEAAGGEPSHQRWQQLASGRPLKGFPKPATIDAISRALSVRPQVVIKACADSLGYSWEAEPKLMTLLPPNIDSLTDEQIDFVRRMIHSFVTAKELGRDFGYEVADPPRHLRAADEGVPERILGSDDDG